MKEFDDILGSNEQEDEQPVEVKEHIQVEERMWTSRSADEYLQDKKEWIEKENVLESADEWVEQKRAWIEAHNRSK